MGKRQAYFRPFYEALYPFSVPCMSPAPYAYKIRPDCAKIRTSARPAAGVGTAGGAVVSVVVAVGRFGVNFETPFDSL